jgi:hypothetical protein
MAPRKSLTSLARPDQRGQHRPRDPLVALVLQAVEQLLGDQGRDRGGGGARLYVGGDRDHRLTGRGDDAELGVAARHAERAVAGAAPGADAVAGRQAELLVLGVVDRGDAFGGDPRAVPGGASTRAFS